MLTIFCGDNTTESRDQFLQHRKALQDKDYEIIDVLSSEIKELKNKVEGTASLFEEKRAFFIQNILSKKLNRELINSLNAEIVIWEEKMDERSIKMYFKSARIFVSKLPHNIWKLLDGVYPGNKTTMLNTLQSVNDSVDQHMILFMLQKRTKELIMIQNDLTGKKKLASWQIGKLKSQASRWNNAKLVSFYKKLFNIEKGIKTGTMFYPVKKSLDILFSFYLQ